MKLVRTLGLDGARPQDRQLEAVAHDVLVEDKGIHGEGRQSPHEIAHLFQQCIGLRVERCGGLGILGHRNAPYPQ